MTVDAIIFDKDGTLFDFQATWTAPFKRFLDEVVPKPLFEKAAATLGFDTVADKFHTDSLVIASTTGEVALALEPVLNQNPQDIVSALNRIGGTAQQVPAVPLRACLSQLGQGRALGLVTNDSEAPARRHLVQENILDLFDFVAGYDSGHGAKPGPGQLLAFAKATGHAPEKTLMVGDSTHDLIAGQAAGMVPVGVLTGVAGEAELRDLAEVVLPDIGHLANWIASR